MGYIEIIITAAFSAALAAAVYICFSSRKAAEHNRKELQEELTSLEQELESLRSENFQLKTEKTSLQTQLEERAAAHKREVDQLKEMKKQLEESFKSLSSEALSKNSEEFLRLAKESLTKHHAEAKNELDKNRNKFDELVKPIKESLGNMDKTLSESEKARHSSFKVLGEKINALKQSEAEIKRETANLVTALRRPAVRGRWGEMQLRNVVEMAGMSRFCDFSEQVTAETTRDRPDMIVNLPNGKKIVVDSKAPLEAYLDSLEAQDETEKNAQLQRHAGHIADQIDKLGGKEYGKQFEQSPEFVVLFLPGEMFFSAALEQKPDLIERGVKKQVILATPTTLIALLKAVAYGWKQQEVAEQARKIHDEALELCKRLSTFSEHLGKIGENIDKTVQSYNSSVSSLEARLMPQARKINQMVQNDKQIEQLSEVETRTRTLKKNQQD
ncbi:DNA recombination protein RmuC [Sedimentisphaera cyanobacteriorum]|uniref:DNA recombination protein RmuC n=1 Tax=Sedimentisphaera cyanobacteriorum TaxID=1940790 RepID=A0A1Q2HR57_9BACT|nr:DNA recombination protein RmuC [Sedimentisphaera cyanobacteriorum]AQQ09754.1 DNA recombination protein RmuC [Sedimentisphaera cyanobacteriorum]